MVGSHEQGRGVGRALLHAVLVAVHHSSELMGKHISVVIDFHGERLLALVVQSIVALNHGTILDENLHSVLLISGRCVVLS